MILFSFSRTSLLRSVWRLRQPAGGILQGKEGPAGRSVNIRFSTWTFEGETIEIAGLAGFGGGLGGGLGNLGYNPVKASIIAGKNLQKNIFKI